MPEYHEMMVRVLENFQKTREEAMYQMTSPDDCFYWIKLPKVEL